MAAVTLLVGLLSGPSIGGWLSEYHRWQSMFYVGLPVTGFILLAMGLSLPEKRAERTPSFDFFGLTTFTFGVIGLQMLLDRGERMEWFNSAEIWAEAAASVLGFYLYLVHVLTAKTHFLGLYGSTIGIAVVLTFFYDNTQAMHGALAKDLTPYRAAAHVTGSIAEPALARLNEMITGQAALVGVIDQFKVMMIPMLIVSPLVLFLRMPPPANQQGT